MMFFTEPGEPYFAEVKREDGKMHGEQWEYQHDLGHSALPGRLSRGRGRND